MTRPRIRRPRVITTLTAVTLAVLTNACAPEDGLVVTMSLDGKTTKAECARFGVARWSIRVSDIPWSPATATVTLACGERWSTASLANEASDAPAQALVGLPSGHHVVTVEALDAGGRVLATKQRAIFLGRALTEALNFVPRAFASADGWRGDLEVRWRVDGRDLDHDLCSPSLEFFDIAITGPVRATARVQCTASRWSTEAAFFDLPAGDYQVEVTARGKNGQVAMRRSVTENVWMWEHLVVDLTRTP